MDAKETIKANASHIREIADRLDAARQPGDLQVVISLLDASHKDMQDFYKAWLEADLQARKL